MEEALTKQESRVLELIAWGAAYKEVPELLSTEKEKEISVETVKMHVKNIKAKLGLSKINEMSAWYFCHRFNISMDLSPLKKKIVSLCLLVVLLPSLVDTSDQYVRTRTRARARTTRVTRARTRIGRRDDTISLI